MQNEKEMPPEPHGNGNGNGNGKDRDYEIIVNAQQKTVTDPAVSFEKVVGLAFPDAQPGQGVIFSITFRHAASMPHAGELAIGNSVEVKKKGTVFNVTRTVQS